ncbi:hypothetical protein K439DRAFT_177317 [Ramaria rubella]|nr:hypothetical protein K439DRAFT_177317 [Ramaria rubella]
MEEGASTEVVEDDDNEVEDGEIVTSVSTAGFDDGVVAAFSSGRKTCSGSFGMPGISVWMNELISLGSSIGRIGSTGGFDSIFFGSSPAKMLRPGSTLSKMDVVCSESFASSCFLTGSCTTIGARPGASTVDTGTADLTGVAFTGPEYWEY